MRSGLALLAALGLVAAFPLPAAAQAVDLIGTWYVLIHYKDDHAGNPLQERWDDKVWVFEEKGTRISWTEYPIAVFDDEKGRFERRHTGQYARILHYWEPDAGQLADIADGLQVNQRGAKTKTLRGSDAKGWSSSRRRSAVSASVVTYQEVWTIEGMPTRPVLTRSDSMGAGRTETVEGATRYATAEVLDGGDLLTGTYERDGTRHGTFRMLRSGEAGALKSQKTQSEIQRQGFVRSIESNPEFRAAAGELIETELAKQRVSLPEDVVNDLAGQAVSLFVQGVPEDQISRRIGDEIRQRVEGANEADAPSP